MRVLVTGGSGYLGQFLMVALSKQHDVAYTYLSRPLDSSSQAYRVNIATGEGLLEAVLGFQPHVVINCAAVSQPAACEQNYESCRALNRPVRLLEALQQLQDTASITALLIHLSTDQVRLLNDTVEAARVHACRCTV
jgi:dTDP-4-dehydrorhamnose reductase